jgi:hypothetical protein
LATTTVPFTSGLWFMFVVKVSLHYVFYCSKLFVIKFISILVRTMFNILLYIAREIYNHSYS